MFVLFTILLYLSPIIQKQNIKTIFMKNFRYLFLLISLLSISWVKADKRRGWEDFKKNIFPCKKSKNMYNIFDAKGPFAYDH